MTTEEIEGKWDQVKGRIQEQWGELTDNDLDQIRGQKDRLVGMIKEKYGQAEQQIEEQLQKLSST